MSNTLLDGFVSTFRETVKKDAEAHMKQHAETYKQRLDQIQTNNAQLLKEANDQYTEKQKKLAERMSEMVDKKVTESNRRLRNELAMINDDLLCDEYLIPLHYININTNK